MKKITATILTLTVLASGLCACSNTAVETVEETETLIETDGQPEAGRQKSEVENRIVGFREAGCESALLLFSH